ncbi:uncharacterized protein KY384_009182 [Bacidia gigantensis]|uniref:uncharacterized protein n=1 Tax=Bacidia gigantensis TaxID=2732470 RepID=UPI001D041932|nr:uncharacterized protein KY384_009182 [Bacidia gigantensis]KAG8525538.1 hypothetical protein KY384_009182 [Bacidia gigantensis]
MGGLVIKRAYILAKQKEEFHALADRIKAIVFLATPHQGADLAQVLSRILNLTPGSRPFLADLHRNSLAIRSINDEFPQYCQELQLRSFYETLPTSFHIGKSMVVDKDSATLNYLKERSAYLNANHREVCKFSSQANPDYQTVRNALASLVDEVRGKAIGTKKGLDIEQRRLLDSYLGVSDTPEDDLMGIDTMRMKGSCKWLMQKDSFQQWRDSMNTQLYWISAKPATGKTVLTGKIIHHLRNLNQDLAFYFFDYRDKAKTTINSFLLSVAWQMAHMHIDVFECLLEIFGKDDGLCTADYRTIWRKLFVEGILRTKINRPQYWIIDALDECKAGSELVSMLLKTTEVSPIRIALTSRDRFESHLQVIRPGQKVVSEDIQENDTKTDIILYLEANMDQLPSIDEEARQDMVSKILTKSAGCFLWVNLTLQELRRVHTSAEIRQVLEAVPSDMDQLYSRILDSMASANYGKKLAKAILTWTACSVRPLTTNELYHALQMDLRDSIDSIERSIESSCGQLVYVDSHSRVQMVHQTARDHLLKDGDTTEFSINGNLGHKRLLMTCLRYLNGNEMRGPKHRRLSASHGVRDRCSFVNYACKSFFEHLTRISPTDDEILSAVARFLNSSNVLSWIEYLAQHTSLNQLILAGEALKKYLQRRSKQLPLLGKDVTLLDSWATDLVRIVTKFGDNLLAYPPAIYRLIPPFCPPQTAPRKQFASSMHSISVLGLSAANWDDCLSTIVKTDERMTALACCDKYFAIGMSNGNIALHNPKTCQEVHILSHLESVRVLDFGKGINVFASGGLKMVRIWDISSWQQVREFNIASMCMSIGFLEEQQLLLGALKNNHLMVWDLMNGSLRESADWTLELDGPNAHSYRRPIAAAFCEDCTLLAVLYRGQDVLLWDLERDALHDTYNKESGSSLGQETKPTTAGATRLLFCAAPNSHLLAVSYSDGDLVLFDTSEGTVMATTCANAQTLACSPDGRTLASANAAGVIQLFDLEALKLLYCISSEEYTIQELAFSGDSHHLLDIRGSQCRVWDPTVLVRQHADHESSDTISISTFAQDFSAFHSDDVTLITSLAIYNSTGTFLCGKEDGTVYLYETKSGQQSSNLFSHAAGVAILYLYLEEDSKIVTSIDTSSRVMAHMLNHSQSGWGKSATLFDQRAGDVVDQALSDHSSTRLLVCTKKRDTLWSIQEGESINIKELLWEDRYSYRWATHPARPDQLILVTNNVAHLYDWQTLNKLTSDDGILLEGSILPELQIKSILHCLGATVTSTTFSEPSKSISESRLLLWSTSDFDVNSASAAPMPKYRSLSSQVKNLIGEYGGRLVFLHASNWVCSANLQSSRIDDYDRHFFLPADWISTNEDILCSIGSNGDILFVKRDQVAVIKRGLDQVEQASRGSGTRSSLLRGARPTLTVPEAFSRNERNAQIFLLEELHSLMSDVAVTFIAREALKGSVHLQHTSDCRHQAKCSREDYTPDRDLNSSCISTSMFSGLQPLLDFGQTFAEERIQPKVKFLFVTHSCFDIHFLALFEMVDVFGSLDIFNRPKQIERPTNLWQ